MGNTWPFVVQEVASGFGASYWVAIDPTTGVCCPGRHDRELAEADLRALNAAFDLGRSFSDSQHEISRQLCAKPEVSQ